MIKVSKELLEKVIYLLERSTPFLNKKPVMDIENALSCLRELIARQVLLEPITGNWIAADDVQRMARELDVAMNGEEGAALAPSLCDVVSQAVEKLQLFAQPVQPKETK